MVMTVGDHGNEDKNENDQEEEQKEREEEELTDSESVANFAADRLVGWVVKVSALREAGPGFDYRLGGDFPREAIPVT